MSGKPSTPDISIERFSKGDQDEFRRIHGAYHEALFFFSLNIVKEKPEAQDIVTEAFIKLWRLRDQFADAAKIKAFLYITTRNASIDFLRFIQRRQSLVKELNRLENLSEEIKNEIITAEVLAELAKKIDKLPDKCGKIFKLIYINNLSTKEVAAQMGISNQNVLNQKARAISILRASILTDQI